MADLSVVMLHDLDSGDVVWLGDEQSAREAVEHNHSLDTAEFEIVADGWRIDVGWDRCNYELKREFVAETGFDSWWEDCSAPADGLEAKKLRRAWRVRWTDAA